MLAIKRAKISLRNVNFDVREIKFNLAHSNFGSLDN